MDCLDIDAIHGIHGNYRIDGIHLIHGYTWNPLLSTNTMVIHWIHGYPWNSWISTDSNSLDIQGIHGIHPPWMSMKCMYIHGIHGFHGIHGYAWGRLRNSDGWRDVLGRLFRTRSVMGRLWDDHFRDLGHPPKFYRVQDACFICGSSILWQLIVILMQNIEETQKIMFLLLSTKVS